MRSDMSLSSDFHWALRVSSPSTVATSAAPCLGGLELHRANHHLELRQDSSRPVLVSADDVDASDALSVQTEVLCEGLSHCE